MKTMRLITVCMVLAMLAGCDKQETESKKSGNVVSLTVATPRISESDQNTEITRSGSASTPAPQTVTVPAGNGMTLEATLEPSPQAATRATTQLAAGVKYRVIAFEQDNVTAAGYKSHADYAVGTDEPVAGNLQVVGGVTYTFVSYSFNTTSLPEFDPNALNIEASPETNDLLYSKFNKYIIDSSKTLSFSFEHKFSQVTVIADATSMMFNLTAISATLSPNYPATLVIADGTLTPGTAAERNIPWGTVTAGETVTANACTVYTNSSTAISVNIPSVTIGQSQRTNFTATFGSNTMHAGKKYTLRLVFKPTAVSPITAAGLTWAPGNLVKRGNTYTFAPAQEMYSGIWDWGDYWGWCQLDPTVLTVYSGDYSVAVDPCQMVSPTGTWRMPTSAEVTSLINAGHVWATKNGVSGMYFGTITVPATGTEDNYLFLPALGIRGYANITMNYVGSIGYYWSSTLFNTSLAYGPCFYSPNSIVQVTANRSTGQPLRCVK